MRLEIVMPTGIVWQGEAQQVRLPSANGSMGILPGHTPIMAGLVPGTIVVDCPDGAELSYTVSDGLVTVDSDHIYVVVESAEKQDSK